MSWDPPPPPQPSLPIQPPSPIPGTPAPIQQPETVSEPPSSSPPGGPPRGVRRRFLKVPVWAWLAGIVGLAAVGAALPDADEGGPSRPSTTELSDVAAGVVSSTVSHSTTTPATSSVPATPPATSTLATQPPTTIPGSLLALDVLGFIAIQNEQQEGYNRDLFGYPGDFDGNGCDTRDDVLARDSIDPAHTDGCEVVAGLWHSSYDDTTWTNADEVEIDHVVALKEAWDSGAWAWDSQRQQQFGNDLADVRTLTVASAAANEQKGDADPSNWIPSNDGAVCQYLADWIAIKARWALAMDESESGRIRNLLTERCPDQLITPWADTPPAPTTVATTVAPITAAPTTPAPPPPSPTQPFFPPTATSPPAGNCEPSYPDVCIPPGPPDLDCGDVPYRRFVVIGSDPHRFDGNNDGIGCESD